MNVRALFNAFGFLGAGFILSPLIWNGLILGSGDAVGFGIFLFGAPAAMVWGVFFFIGEAVSKDKRPFRASDRILMFIGFAVGVAAGICTILAITVR